jgi:glutamate-1-semialdehyde aminotransferase
MGGDEDVDVVVLPADYGAATRMLAEEGDRWAALVVDPMALASLIGGGGSGMPAGPEWAARAPGALVVADERRTLGAGPGGGHRHFDLRPDLVVLGASLFGGLGGGALGGRREVTELAAAPALAPLAGAGAGRSGPDGAGGATGARPPRPGARQPARGALHPVLAAAGLATLQLATPSALADLDARADRLRAAISGRRSAAAKPRFAAAELRSAAAGRHTSGLGAAVALPVAATPELLVEHGVLVDGSGWGWLATVSTDEDVDEVVAVLSQLG